MANRFQNRPLVRLTNRIGLAALLLIALPPLLAALVYQGEAGEHYSFLNHSLSELGRYGSSPLAALVNGGLFFGGLALTLSFLMSSWLINRNLRSPLLVCGVMLSLSLCGCGLFPVNVGALHAKAMLSFYVMTILCAVFYCHSILTDKPPRWGVLPAVTAAILAMMLLSREDLLLSLQDRYPYGLFGIERPLIWWPALLGWALMLSVILWLYYSLVLVFRDGDSTPPPQL
ncbi:hypothetical protein [Ferrimonas aestuarii]|uniref:DUF998 domain-containing protein n=1 Tax=Ferrimonas aestuarii TaxID=2569539 RepID=A0A4U1BEK7_9GAMM|nr:hypothetical protein [Ferrimonas aestuarii]TKB49602.1 hypothetical protein FCL42_20365 [Ferrimonas aestuarii]